MSTKTKGLDVGALDDAELAQMYREARAALDDRSHRGITRAQAHERLHGQREAAREALSAAVDEAAYRVATMADPGVPDLGAVALAALCDPAHPYWAALEQEIERSERFSDADADPAELRERVQAMDAELRRRALDRAAEEAREGVVRA